MREDILGMLRNAIEHGGNPSKVAQSLINSGYSMKEVKEALDFITSNNQIVQQANPQQVQNQTQQPKSQSKQVQGIEAPPPPQQLTPLKPLPSQKTNPHGIGKIIILVIALLLLVGALTATIIYKDELLGLLGL